MADRTCKIDGCSDIAGLPGTARGLCRIHYTQHLRNRDRRCSSGDCEALVRSKGLCVKHYSRLLRHGHIEATKVWYDIEQTCSVPDCTLPVRTRGWCQPHYMRWYRDDDVAPDAPLVGVPHPDPAERFWKKVDKTDQCWRWRGCYRQRAGRFPVRGSRSTRSHRGVRTG